MPATVASALSNFMFRRTAERVETEEPQTTNSSSSNTYAYDVELGSETSSENNSITEEPNFDDEDNNLEEGHFVGRATTATPPRTNTTTTTSGNVNVDDIATQEGIAATVAASLALDPTGTVLPISSTAATTASTVTTTAAAATTTTPLNTTRNAVSLRALEEERLAMQRRSGSCVLLAGFFLFQLWIQAVSSGDFGLLLLCLVFTSWTARFVRYTREQEDEMTQQIQTWNEPGGGGSAETNDDGGTTGSSAFDEARRLRRMSFQSQLALAIIQSQIQLMETGGHGHPDGGTARGDGLTEDDKQRWDRFSFTSTADLVDRGLFNDTAKDVSIGTGKDQTHDAAPECTICLCEYEPGDTMVALPCKHVFHDDCLTAWTAQNTRCPLCNTDLSAAAARTTA